MLGATNDWRELTKYLASHGIGSRAVDLWRFLACEPMPLARFGAALNAETCSETKPRQRILLGYSMGGRLALHALLAQPGLWTAAIIVSSHPGLESERERAERRAADAAWATRALTGNWSDLIAAWDKQPLLAGPGEISSRNALALRRREIARAFVDWSLGIQDPLWQKLRQLGIPMLWIAGENDGKFRELAGRAVLLCPDACLAIAPNSGHRVPWQNPAWFHQTVIDFILHLAGCDSRLTR
jgi:2-succinyl-6-hydroxy-2,4-cyclohexadiene-1-carboxylate synthase